MILHLNARHHVTYVCGHVTFVCEVVLLDDIYMPQMSHVTYERDECCVWESVSSIPL